MKESHKALEKRLAGALEAMKQAQGSADRAQTHLFEATSHAEMRISAMQSERDLQMAAAERSDAKIAELEKQIEELRLVANCDSTIMRPAEGAASTNKRVKALHDESNQTLHILVSELQQELRKKEDQFRIEKQKLETSNKDLNELTRKQKEEVETLKKEVSSRPSREELTSAKRQLKVLQKVAFNVEDDDEDDEGASGEGMDPERTSNGSGHLEVLLSSRFLSEI